MVPNIVPYEYGVNGRIEREREREGDLPDLTLGVWFLTWLLITKNSVRYDVLRFSDDGGCGEG